MKNVKLSEIFQAALIAGFLYLLFFIIAPFLQNL